MLVGARLLPVPQHQTAVQVHHAPGAVIAALVWLAARWAFFYVSNFSSWARPTGPWPLVIVLLLYFFISAAILLPRRRDKRGDLPRGSRERSRGRSGLNEAGSKLPTRTETMRASDLASARDTCWASYYAST